MTANVYHVSPLAVVDLIFPDRCKVEVHRHRYHSSHRFQVQVALQVAIGLSLAVIALVAGGSE